jgi:DNA polymerase III delta prime subunit
MQPQPSEGDAPRKRKHSRDKQVNVQALREILEQQGWDAKDLADQAAVTDKTIKAALAGGYIRKASADKIQQCVSKFSRTPILLNNEGPAPVQAGTLASPLSVLYSKCNSAALTIRDHIRIADFRKLIEARTRDFVGRNWLFDAMDGFLNTSTHGYFILKGPPGVGKTTFAAEVTKRHGCVHHFNSRFGNVNRTDQFLGSVCGQLIAAYELPHQTLPARAIDGSGILVGLLTEVIRRRLTRRVLIVIDSADEVRDAFTTRTNILSLPVELPEGCFVLLTQRNVDLPLRIECPQHASYLDQKSAANLHDLETFLINQTKKEGIIRYMEKQRLTPARFTAILQDRSEGNFMYLNYVLPEIESGRWTETDWENLPIGLRNYYESHWQLLRDADQAAWFGYKLPILRALATSPGPLPIALLAERLSNISIDIVRDVIQRDWRQFLESVELPVGSATTIGWRLYHSSFADFLKEKASDPQEQIDFNTERDRWLKYWQEHGITAE